ncbi:MAG TPA: VOC family protein [Gemmatimonadales bacterium]|nr:VOC family protein [Gemmatimonadales bacterium]
MSMAHENPAGGWVARRSQPETLRLRAVMPVLTVTDIERSLAWYRDILGFVVHEEARRNGRVVAVQLKAGKVRFLLEQDPRPDRPRVRGEGLRLYCATRQDIDRLAAAIQERGGTLAESPGMAHEGRDFTIVDPDGFTISIYWRPDS